MTYSPSMAAAARRHLEAAENLLPTNRGDVAGYLFGIAAECALKQMMLNSGMRPAETPSGRRTDPFFAHFQDLKAMVRDQASGRLQAELRRYAENAQFLQFWDVTMRYSDGRAIQQLWIGRWQKDAKDIIGAMDL